MEHGAILVNTRTVCISKILALNTAYKSQKSLALMMGHRRFKEPKCLADAPKQRLSKKISSKLDRLELEKKVKDETGRSGFVCTAVLALAPVSALADGTTFLYQTVISPGDPAFTQLLGIKNGGTIAGYLATVPSSRTMVLL
jgi:hypothetical protein